MNCNDCETSALKYGTAAAATACTPTLPVLDTGTQQLSSMYFSKLTSSQWLKHAADGGADQFCAGWGRHPRVGGRNSRGIVTRNLRILSCCIFTLLCGALPDERFQIPKRFPRNMSQ